MFQLTKEETDTLSRSQFVTSIQTKGVKGGRSYRPYAFTESGIYMLMTVLKGDLATRQSKALIRTFKSMKDYVVHNKGLIEQHNYLQLSMQMTEMQKELSTVRQDLKSYGAFVLDHDQRLIEVMEQLNDTVRKSELSPIMLDFDKPEIRQEYIFLDGQPMKADNVYITICSKARKTVYIVDDYIGAKTLHLLQDVQPGVSVTIFSDNNYNKLKASDYSDFHMEFPKIPLSFIQTMKKAHDRFIVLDFGTDDEKIFHCGASSKDAGKRVAAVTEFKDGSVKEALHNVILQMLSNPPLVLA